MPRVCLNICETLKGVLHTSTNSGGAKKGYKDNWKRCAFCEYNINTNELRCKCCKGIFRTKTRRKKNKNEQMPSIK